MHRRNLTLRRFGPLSFGLGYWDDGVWVDHSVAADRPEMLSMASDADRAALDAIHDWFACCREPALPLETVLDGTAGLGSDMAPATRRSRTMVRTASS
jgi:hypothetical protein